MKMFTFSKKEKKKYGLEARPRAMDALHAEYGKLCAELGSKNYQIAVLEAEVDEVIKKISAVNLEAAKAKESDLTPPEGGHAS